MQVAQTVTSGEWPASPSEEKRDGAASVDLAVLTDLRQLDETGEVLTTLITHFLDETPRLQEHNRHLYVRPRSRP